jgi:hypothetical protein
MHHNSQKPMVPKIYVQFYCVIKYDVQNKTILDISISKLNLFQKKLWIKYQVAKLKLNLLGL